MVIRRLPMLSLAGACDKMLPLDRTARGHLQLVDAAAMLCTTDYIPADSSHEVAMARALVAADRQFIKPLRYEG
jgi:hypothetical protein